MDHAQTTAPGPMLHDHRPDASRREEVLGTAAGVFDAKGYAASTMADIANGAGILPGSLYHHFASKEAIAIELLERFIADLDATASAFQPSRAAEPEERLRELIATVMAASFRHPAAVRLRAFEPPAVTTGLLQKAIETTSPTLDRLYETSVADLALVDSEAGDSALLRYALETLALEASIRYTSDAPVETLATNLVDLLLHGLAVDAPSSSLRESTAVVAAHSALERWTSSAKEREPSVREEILAAARQSFARRGTDATTVRDIAAAANITMGTLYRNAASKDELVREIIQTYDSGFDSATRAALATDDPLQALSALAWVFINAGRTFREESDIIRGAGIRPSSPKSPLHAYFEGMKSRLALLRGLLERGAADGTLRPLATEPDIALTIRFVMWLPYQDVGAQSADDVHGFLERAVIRGLAR